MSSLQRNRRPRCRVAGPRCLAVLVIAGLTGAGNVAAQEPSRFLDECPPSDPSQLLVSLDGVVTDKKSEALLPGAVVRLEYQDRAALPTGVEPELETVTDERGRYRFCGLLAFARSRVSAVVGGREGKAVEIELSGDRSFDLTFELGDPAYLVFSVVAAETGEPVSNARIELAPIPLAAMTDSLGRAALRRVPPYEYNIRARHIGYAVQEQSLTVEEGQQAEVRIELITQAIALEPSRSELASRAGQEVRFVSLCDLLFYVIAEGNLRT